MREHEIYDRVDEIAQHTEQMPHGADHLARLFRDSGQWQDLQEWYVAHAKRWGQRLPWALGQLGTMFPTESQVHGDVRTLFGEILSSVGTPLPLLSVAGQRLAAWDPEEARVLIREALGGENHPLARRTLALAALHAGEVRSVIRQCLRQHDENALLLGMLEDTNFARSAIPVSPDFAG
jgi:hypothetical protein